MRALSLCNRSFAKADQGTFVATTVGQRHKFNNRSQSLLFLVASAPPVYVTDRSAYSNGQQQTEWTKPAFTDETWSLCGDVTVEITSSSLCGHWRGRRRRLLLRLFRSNRTLPLVAASNTTQLQVPVQTGEGEQTDKHEKKVKWQNSMMTPVTIFNQCQHHRLLPYQHHHQYQGHFQEGSNINGSRVAGGGDNSNRHHDPLC